MNKKFAEFLTQRNLSVNGNLAYGVIDGFETNVFYNAAATFPVQFHFSCFLDADRRSAALNLLTAQKPKQSVVQLTPYGLTLAVNDLTLNRLINSLDETLKNVCNVLHENGALGIGYCPVCGKELDFEQSKKCNVDGFTVSLDNDCVDSINASITQANKEFDQAPNNYLRGFLGALLGGLAGVALAVVLYLVGFISTISAFVSFYVGTLLYSKFGGKRNKVMIVIVTVTTVVLMLATTAATYVVEAGIAAAEAGLEMSGIDAFSYLMQDSEFAGYFYKDLALTLVFCAVGCGYEIFALNKKVKKAKTI